MGNLLKLALLAVGVSGAAKYSYGGIKKEVKAVLPYAAVGAGIYWYLKVKK